MTIQEIRDLIAKKIEGQGTMVDVGGGLPAILNAICDAIEGGGSEGIISVPFASTAIFNDWTEIKVNAHKLPLAYAIKCTDGVVLASRIAAVSMVEIYDGVGTTVSGVFGTVAVSDIIEAASLFCFSVEDSVVKVKTLTV